MEYLHRSSCLHGNLRVNDIHVSFIYQFLTHNQCNNVLIDDQGHALVGDFGISRHFPQKYRFAKAGKSFEDPPTFHSAFVPGSLYWLAPECLEGGVHTYSSDIWSFSISAFEVHYFDMSFDLVFYSNDRAYSFLLEAQTPFGSSKRKMFGKSFSKVFDQLSLPTRICPIMFGVPSSNVGRSIHQFARLSLALQSRLACCRT